MDTSNATRTLALMSLVATVAMASWLLGVRPDWSAWDPATCLPDSCFCEADRGTSIRQPVNALSSLSFCIVGLVVLLTSNRRKSQRADDTYLFWFATTMIGLGSAFYHASLTFVGQTFDVLGMYLLVTLLLMWSAQRFLQLSDTQRVWGYVLGNAGLLAVLVAVPTLRRYVFGALVLTVIVLEVKSSKKLYLGWAVGLLAVGFTIWIGDMTGALCSPESLVQGHALWHLCGAAASYLIYAHYHRPVHD